MLKRWRDVVILALVGLIVFEVVFPPATEFALKTVIPGYYSHWLIWASLFVGLVLIAFLITEPFRFSKEQFRLLLRQPPLWFPVVLSLALAVFAEALPENLALQHGHIDWVTLPILATLAVCFGAGLVWRHKLHSSDVPPILALPKSQPIDWSALKGWVESDEPASIDLFDHSAITNRIVSFFRRSRKVGSVALLGDYGTGKTSILNWTKAKLASETERRYVFVELNCWGVYKGEDLPRIALTNIIERLEDHVDIQDLRSLPKNYQQLVQSEPSGMLARVLQSSPTGDALNELKRLSPLLKNAGLHVLLIIEDADRTTKSFQTRHIERLLWTLKGVEGISFILSFDHRRTPLDAFKLCDTVELITQPEADHVRRLLALAYEHWIDDFEFIDAETPQVKRDHDPWEVKNVNNELLSYLRDAQRDGAIDALSSLLKSPRSLKHIIRRVDSAWSRLHGEVDLAQLIAVTALRYGAPDAFEFIVTNIAPARQQPKESGFRNALNVRPAWDKLLNNHPHQRSIQRITDILGLEQLSKKAVIQGRVAAQGVQSAEHPDYFRRILSEQLEEGEVSDQRVLHEIEAWRSSKSPEMVRSLLATTSRREGYLRSWEPFATRLNRQELYTLAELLIDDALNDDGDAEVEEYPALLAVWRRFNRMDVPQSHIDWLAVQIRRAIPVSINFGCDLFYFFGSARSSFVNQNDRVALRQVMLDAAKAAFTTSQALGAALSSKRTAYSLRRLMFAPEDEFYSDLPAWRWLLPIAIEGARTNPNLFGLQLIPLLGDYSQRMSFPKMTQEYAVNDARAKEVFAEQMTEALEIAATVKSDDPYIINAVQHIAARLEGTPGPATPTDLDADS